MEGKNVIVVVSLNYLQNLINKVSVKMGIEAIVDFAKQKVILNTEKIIKKK